MSQKPITADSLLALSYIGELKLQQTSSYAPRLSYWPAATENYFAAIACSDCTASLHHALEQVLRVLLKLLETSRESRTLAVAASDLGRFIAAHPHGRNIVAGAALGHGARMNV